MSLKTETTAQTTAANDDAPKLNRRQAAKVATRAKLIASARKLWAEPGTYEAIGIREISAAAGMSTGAIFANWKGKADLWREAMGFEPPVDSEAVRAALKAQADADVRMAA
ncbi:helix-turn-helix domain-containing protein [Brevundimonas sp.]|uniref:TetR/AcrR family transcriptional regulator n=1 Tax=Brevundimonas sp. TaxID=1871086 RepID=UPI0028AFEE8D|nr:helix-turn-helix domain-containing protein [Brevundimonas sp.]